MAPTIFPIVVVIPVSRIATPAPVPRAPEEWCAEISWAPPIGSPEVVARIIIALLDNHDRAITVIILIEIIPVRRFVDVGHLFHFPLSSKQGWMRAHKDCAQGSHTDKMTH
jgi:hypothetical protein